MSGDVHVRKRKDNKIKKKKDSIDLATAELIARKLSLKDDDDTKHAGVHAGKMGPDDLLMHLQKDESTGGHWCAKIVFFSLMAVLFGLVGLIILENRGINDLDTPLSESRFSEYFEGWVDEHREGDHDEHEVLVDSLNDLDDHSHDNEPFAEEDDNSEANDDDEDDEHDDEHDEEEEEENQSDEETNEDDDDTSEQNENDDVDNESVEEEPIDNNENNEESEQEPDQEPDQEENTDDDDDGVSQEDETTKNVSFENNDVDDNDDDNDDDDSPFEEPVNTNTLITGEKLEKQVDELIKNFNKLAESVNHPKHIETQNTEIKEKTYEKSDVNVMDDDGSFEEVFENDDGEDLHLQKIAQKKQEPIVDETIEEPVQHESSPADEKKTEQQQVQSLDSEYVNADILMKRRPTIIDPADAHLFSQNDEENLEEYSDEEEEYSDEEAMSEEELKDEEPNKPVIDVEKIVPQTYEQLKAMYKAQVPENETPEPTEEINEDLRSEEIPVDADYNEDEEEEGDYDDDEDEEDELEDDDDDEHVERDELEEDEEISDVDDNELMKRLESRYGRLPAAESDDDKEEETWTKLPSRGPQEFDEENIEEELSRANALLEDEPTAALKILNSLVLLYPKWPEVLYGKAKALDRLSELKQSNLLLTEAIENYLKVLTFGKNLNQTFIKTVGERCIFRMRFKGLHAKAVTVHKLLINRFKDDPHYRNELAITYMLNNKYAEAKFVLHETLLSWRYDGLALVHYGFVLKNLDNNLKEAVTFLQEGIDSNADGTQDGRFYLALGDSLMRLGRNKEATAIYKKGAKKHVFLSEHQRSLYNVDRLKSHPFWTKKETTQDQYFKILEENWEKIRDEGLSVLNEAGYFKNETESLRDYGDWKQFELFSRGQKNIRNCAKAPFTCKVIETFPAARFCTRGQIKFSVLHPGTHIWPHTGPTNCRIRAHLGLKVPAGTLMRVAHEKRSWDEGKILCFDDSFEHEVWHNGTTTRLVLIVDVWHPDLTEAEWKSLSPI